MHSDIEQQLKHNDCGISAVKIIYNLHNIHINRNYLEENIYVTENGSSLHDIKDFFDKQHFQADFNLLDLNSLKFNSDKLKALVPCILPVKNTQGLHYVVIKGFRKNKLQILDPGIGQSYLWTLSELMNNAYTATANYDYVSNSKVLQQIIREELIAYQLNPEKVEDQNEGDVINKLTYFSYLKENFGFADSTAEKNFLVDLLFNQELSVLPKQFRTLKLREAVLRITAPVVLTVKKTAEVQLPSTSAIVSEKPINPYRRLFKELKPYHKLWGIYIATAVFAALLGQLTIFSSQILIDYVLPDYNLSLLVLFALGLGLFKVFNLILSLYKSFISIHLANILDNFFLTSFIEKLNTYSIRYIHTFSRGDLTERIQDSLKLKTFFMRFFTGILIDSIVTVYSLVVLFILDFKITFIVVGILVIFIVWFFLITPYIRENENRRFLEKSNLFSSLFENIDGLQVIKSFRLEGLFMQRLGPRIKNILGIQRRVKYVSLINSGVINFIMIIASILILVFLSQNAITTRNISMGQVITFIAFSSQVFSSVSSLLDQNLDIQENQIILSRYFDFGSKEAQTTAATFHSKIRGVEIQTVTFRNVGFHYIPQRPVFSNLNIVINKGEIIKLEGSNGAGKSTFCKLLSLLYTPDQGEILINNEKFSFYNPSSLRKKILLVSNEDIVFNDTLGFNMAFSYSVNTARVLALAKEIGLYEFITEKAEGLDFVINEQGSNLSTGQRKKILMMRAFLSEAELIILDETLSGIDVESKEKIENYINNQTNRSFIIVSHEPLYRLRFSNTIIMQNGSIEQLQYQGV
ncbi:ABC transporter transmembrane domain-containing protein [Adhaeribacter radiodurans]|uniref:ATP-binding cassette domain-containing protein n=1 Tax=Adhaeribacter radiodurans TaxID=2745197 RepID=A0A7L7LDI5_9BACT|nr:ABC transporter transmembrane domain-containing protein [Adhaeribacter radiodurans]QMU30459.1 ATP-binding cassette domain-containing protein [Adhaeribacter radiodurans]